MGKKNLDELFQEKLKDISQFPEESVWPSIEASLDKKKKSRKIIPFWWKLGGVAAVLLIAITLIYQFEVSTTGTPVDTDVKVATEKKSEENKKKTDATFENQTPNKNQLVNTQEENILNQEKSSADQVVSTQTISKDTQKSISTQKNTSKKEPIKNQNAIRVQVVNSGQRKVEKVIEKNEPAPFRNNINKITQKTEVVESGTFSNLEKRTSSQVSDTKANGLSAGRNKPSKKGIAQNDEDDASEEPSKKKSIFDEIDEQKEKEIIAENSRSKWSAGPSIAPVYFNAIGEGSPVHSIFVPNSKSGDINFSYGLSVAYEVSKKLSIRSGVHKVDYGYRTNDVEFSSSFESASNSQIDNIDYTVTSRNLVVSSKANTRTEALNQNPFLDTSADFSAVSTTRSGSMEQQFGYLEVPVELNYAIISNKFGVNLIGGISSLFLVDNTISLSSGELITEIGEANNINSVNFSTNVGFGLNYKFTPKVQLNVEPVFKYQLYTFSETDGTFNPFSVGIYSGLSFRF